MNDSDTIDRLQAWASGHNPNVRAAVALLIEQPRWIHDDDLIAACVITDGHGTYLNFAYLGKFVDANPRCSAAEMVMLRLIYDLGSGRYQFHRLDGRNVQLAIDAFTQAAQR